jgi:two-component system, NtrC family, response regulator AtoC
VFSARGAATHRLSPGAQLTVGRGEDADIVIDDVAVSRKHAIFHAGPPLELEDLGSSNGTFVSKANAGNIDQTPPGAKTADQKRVAVTGTRLQLGVGDSVSFGAALVVVRPARAAAVPAASPSQEGAVVRAPALVRLYEEAARAAQMSLPILIVGETGVGKDVLARFIHERSARAKRPMIALNCAALSDSLAESELFGHEKGAFTGAQQARPGLFESASGGTVFLDEIGELPLTTQAKLLRALESGEIQRLGSSKTLKIDVRFVSATNRDLEKSSAEGKFRQDLYFRVNGITLNVPPLRERVSEIAELAARFLAAASKQAGLAKTPELSGDALRALEGYAWPGNVRELRYVMERTLVTARDGDGPILPEHLPAQVRAPDRDRGQASQASAEVPASGREESATRERVIEALARADGNQTRAAELLGVSRRTLINRMIEFNLPRPRKG